MLGSIVLSGSLVALAAVPAAAAAAAPPRSFSAQVDQGRPVPFTAASVTPAGAGKVTVSWTAPGVGHVRIEAGKTSTTATRVVAVGPGRGSRTLPTTGGSWFQLVPEHGRSLTLTVRDPGLVSDPNLRDFGGYRTSDGRWVRMGMIYRSQALTLSPTDQQVVDQLGITADYDLRTPAESTAKPDVVPAGATYTQLNVLGSGLSATPALTSETVAQQLLQDGERQFVTNATSRQVIGTLLTDFAGASGPVLFHCTAGKDRSGWVSAVLLTLLGVDRDTVMRDYLLSNQYYYDSPAVQASLAALPPAQANIYRHLSDVEPSYLQAGLDQVRTSYGSMENYAVKGLGLSSQTLKDLRSRLLVGRS